VVISRGLSNLKAVPFKMLCLIQVKTNIKTPTFKSWSVGDYPWGCIVLPFMFWCYRQHNLMFRHSNPEA